MSGNDPRSIDPARAERDEADVAAGQGSSTPLVDGEEQTGTDESNRHDDERAALDAMPDSDGTSDDQVVSRQPDSEDRED